MTGPVNPTGPGGATVSRAPTARAILLAATLLAGGLLATAPAADAGRTEMRSWDVLFTDISAANGVTPDPAHGHLWFATEGGLVRTDPTFVTRTVFTPYHGLPSALVWGSRVVGDDLWVVTGGGLARLHIPTGNVTPFTQLQGALNDFTLALDATPTDLWVGSDAGLLHYDLANGTREKFNRTTTPLPADRVLSVALDGDAVWVGTTAGLARYHPGNGSWRAWSYPGNGLPSGTIRAIAPTGSAILLATPKGALRLDRATQQVTELSLAPAGITTKSVRTLAVNGHEAWFGTEEGIAILDTASESWRRTGRRDGLSHDTVTGIAFHNGTLVGIATRGGLNLLDLPRVHYTVMRTDNGPYHNTILTAAVDGDYVWWGTGGGASQLDPARLSWAHLTLTDGLPGNWVYGLHFDDDRIWFATTGGIAWLWRGNGTWGSRAMSTGAVSGEVARAIDGDAHEVWVGNAFLGVMRYNRTTDQWTAYGTGTSYTGDHEVNTVLVDWPHVWIGTETGVTRFDRRTQTWSNLEDPRLQGRTITTFARDADRILIGTEDAGVIVHHRATGTLETWNRTNGKVPSDRVRALAFDGPRLWAGFIGDGAAVHDPTTGNWTIHTSLTGLANDYVNAFAFTNDTLYLGTFTGVSRIDRATGRFLPMQQGPGALLRPGDPAGPTGGPGNGTLPPPGNASFTPPAIAITRPTEGETLTDPLLVEGDANVAGAAITAVYVRIDGGAWMKAQGARNWSATIPTGGLDLGAHTLEAQAWSGQTPSPIARVAFHLEEASSNLTLTHAAPAQAAPLAPTPLTAHVSSPRATVTLLYTTDPAVAPQRIAMALSGTTATGAIPALPRAGPVYYAFEAHLGNDAARSPLGRGYHTLQVPAEAAGEVGRIPETFLLGPGSPLTTRVPVTNTGNVPLEARFEVRGLAATDVVAAIPATVTIPVGETAQVPLELTLDPRAVGKEGRAVVKVTTGDGRVIGTTDFGWKGTAGAPATPHEDGGRWIPTLPLPLLLALTAAAALLAARRRPT